MLLAQGFELLLCLCPFTFRFDQPYRYIGHIGIDNRALFVSSVPRLERVTFAVT